MSVARSQKESRKKLSILTKTWGPKELVDLYLERCQVSTPVATVNAVWELVRERRRSIGSVLDFGAGDGRFATYGSFKSYTGYEIDPSQIRSASLPENARLLTRCAFSSRGSSASLCIGNPPYVRNQDLPEGWRTNAARVLAERCGIRLSGLANAWQYFFLLSIISARANGLVALVIPYEWVSRPSAAIIRQYISDNGWDVSVYRLRDDTFERVLTTSSITIVEKRNARGIWRFYQADAEQGYRELETETGYQTGVLSYESKNTVCGGFAYASRGLSPGTQAALTLTEGERARSGLRVGLDVVPCVTSLKSFDADAFTLTPRLFDRLFREIGQKCWLIRTDVSPSKRLRSYLESVPENLYQTSTCLKRKNWWQFTMPETPDLLGATGFRGSCPKLVVNGVGAKAVGGVAGIRNVRRHNRVELVRRFRELELAKRIVTHSDGFKKIEINQYNSILKSIDPAG